MLSLYWDTTPEKTLVGTEGSDNLDGDALMVKLAG